jgi:L-threonate 2-dehydrogenase
MGITVAVMAQGTMGAGVGKRLSERGATVRTLLSGRSEASAGRARAAGMQPVADARELLTDADYFLSILPPDQALGLASQMAPALQSLPVKPVYVDCNAVSPQTALRIAAIVEPTGATFVDGGIIGGPPRDGYAGPAIYASGAEAERTQALKDWGLDWRITEGPIGAASGLKMSYAGITKGTTAIAAALLGAARFGCAEALIAELSSSQPEMLKRMKGGIPGMYDKAYRWVGEMEEISDFLDANAPSSDMYKGIARLYEFLAAAEAEATPADGNAIKTLDKVLGR